MDYYVVDSHALAVIREIRSRNDIRLLPSASLPQPSPRGTRFSLRRFAIPGLASLSSFDAKRPVMLMAPSKDRRYCSRAVKGIVCTEALPTGSFYTLDIPPWLRRELSLDSQANYHIAGPALCLVSIAAHFQRLVNKGKTIRAVALLRLAAIAMELTGTFARDPLDPRGDTCTFDLDCLLSIDALVREVDLLHTLHGSRLARAALELATGGAASPMESLHFLALTLPAELGGLGLPRPQLNEPIATSRHERRLMDFPRMRPDLQWAGQMVAIEHEGRDWHDSGERHETDVRRIQDYQVCGWKVFPATAFDIRTPARYRRFALKLCDALDQRGLEGLFKRVETLMGTSTFHASQQRLFDTVGAPKRQANETWPTE